MRREYFVAMDTHCRTTDACIKTGGGKLVRREHTPTTIPHLRAVIESVPRPRRVTFEESSMAGPPPSGCIAISRELLTRLWCVIRVVMRTSPRTMTRTMQSTPRSSITSTVAVICEWCIRAIHRIMPPTSNLSACITAELSVASPRVCPVDTKGPFVEKCPSECCKRPDRGDLGHVENQHDVRGGGIRI